MNRPMFDDTLIDMLRATLTQPRPKRYSSPLTPRPTANIFPRFAIPHAG